MLSRHPPQPLQKPLRMLPEDIGNFGLPKFGPRSPPQLWHLSDSTHKLGGTSQEIIKNVNILDTLVSLSPSPPQTPGLWGHLESHAESYYCNQCSADLVFKDQQSQMFNKLLLVNLAGIFCMR